MNKFPFIMVFNTLLDKSSLAYLSSITASVLKSRDSIVIACASMWAIIISVYMVLTSYNKTLLSCARGWTRVSSRRRSNTAFWRSTSSSTWLVSLSCWNASLGGAVVAGHLPVGEPMCRGMMQVRVSVCSWLYWITRNNTIKRDLMSFLGW